MLVLKVISCYQLIGKPDSEAALKIRQIKGRENKPFAVMFSDIDMVKQYCVVNKKEEELLKSFARPIVLLEKKTEFPYEVCKDSRYIGAFLPSAGIHRLLCDQVGPLIVTSANISDEPIIIDDDEFIDKFRNSDLGGVLCHERQICIPQDDSVLFVTKLSDGQDITSFNRRSRGYAPLPVLLKDDIKCSCAVLAMGGDLKNTFSFAKNRRIVTSPYIGDLKDFKTAQNEKELIDRLSGIFAFTPERIVCDLHPLYESRNLAVKLSEAKKVPLIEVQHHHAHILSVMAENSLNSCIGIAFDGTGFGTDGKIWGGEVLYCNGADYHRSAHLSYVKLCGGDRASKLAMQVSQCYEFACAKAHNSDTDNINPIVKAALSNNIGTFETSSAGRLFDAVSALLGIKNENSFEGECAIALEKEAWNYLDVSSTNESEGLLSINILKEGETYIIDQLKLYEDIKSLKESGQFSILELSYAFHRALSNAIIEICDIVRKNTNENKVCLSGGVFGNRLLLKLSFEGLLEKGFDVFSNSFVPAGDAGISLGQAYYCCLAKDA